VAQKLALQWSPQQISGWLKQEFPTHQDMQISHEAIYRSLFIQTRGVLKKELTAQLRTARRMRQPQEPQREEWAGAYPRYAYSYWPGIASYCVRRILCRFINRICWIAFA
jgi:IS30 family transposase